MEYSYDTWGVPTIVYDNSDFSLGTINPIRYRGYYYDSETKLYYLQSRYYNPEVGRFLNADGTLNGNGDITGFNMFAYCSNNPVMYSDPSGNFALPVVAKILGIVAFAFLGLSMHETMKTASTSQTLGNAFGKASTTVGFISTVVTVIDEKSTVLKNKEQYSKDVVNSKHLKSGELYSSPNKNIFGSDETYTKQCIAVRESALLESGVLDANVTWEDLVESGNSSDIIEAMPSWDLQSSFAMGLSSANAIVKSLCGLP